MPSPNEATGTFLPIIAGTLCLSADVCALGTVRGGANYSLPSDERRKHTLARSIGWMMTDAKVAAEPPQTKGSAVLANPMMVGGSAGGGEQKMMRFAKVPIACCVIAPWVAWQRGDGQTVIYWGLTRLVTRDLEMAKDFDSIF